MFAVSRLVVLALLGLGSFTAVAHAETSPLSAPAISAEAAAWTDPFAKGSRYWAVTTAASDDAIFGYANMRRTPSGVLGGPEVGVRWQRDEGSAMVGVCGSADRGGVPTASAHPGQPAVQL